ncbi:right-handed parallel beta-helix repeat-containing protein, partial [Escherichia coli]|nr:right-handed parallel beta-helix repeat-containing protein [Escherichia coli]
GGFKLLRAKYTRITGLRFDGSDASEAWGTSIWGSHHITFARNEITGYRPGDHAQGILLRGARHIRIDGNRIHDLGSV